MPYKNKDREKEFQKEYSKKYREENKTKLLQQKKIYYLENKAKFSQKAKIYRLKNLDKIMKRDKIYYLKYKDKKLKKAKIYRLKNLDKFKSYNIRNKDSINKWHEEYIKTPRGKNYRQVINARRNAKKKLLHHSFTVDEWKKKLKDTFGICSGYKKEPHYVGVEKLTLDHISPIAFAPINFEYTINDVQPLCKSCNSSKSTSL